MKYERAGGLHGIIVRCSMEGGERHGHDDPVLIRIDPVDEDNDHRDEQVEKKEAPAFADLDKEFAQILLDIVPADDEGDDEPGHSEGDPDGLRESGDGKNDLWDNIRPGPVPGKVEDEKQEIIGKREAEHADQPFTDAEGTHGQEPEKHEQQEGDGGDVQQGNDPGPKADVEDGRAGVGTIVQIQHAVPDEDHHRVDQQRRGKMAPVRQKGSNQDIGHAGQPGRLWENFMMVEDTVEQGRLGEQEYEGKDRKKDREPVEHLIEPVQDEAVKIVVLRMQGGRHGMQKKREFEHQGICKQY